MPAQFTAESCESCRSPSTADSECVITIYSCMSVTGMNASADLSAKFPRSSLSGRSNVRNIKCLRGEKAYFKATEVVDLDLLKETMSS